MELVWTILVGGDWDMTCSFPDSGNVIIPIDESICFRGVRAQPPTSIAMGSIELDQLIENHDPSPNFFRPGSMGFYREISPKIMAEVGIEIVQFTRLFSLFWIRQF